MPGQRRCGQPSESALTPSRTGITAIDKPVEATVPNDPAALPRFARWRQRAQTSPVSPALPRAAGRMLAPIRSYLLTRINGGYVTGLRWIAAPQVAWAGVFRGLAELVDLAGAAFTDVTDAMCGLSLCELFSRRSNSAPPPTASNSGHSTSRRHRLRPMSMRPLASSGCPCRCLSVHLPRHPSRRRRRR